MNWDKIKGRKRYITISLLIIGTIIWLLVIKNAVSKPIFVTEKIERCTITQLVEASGTINPVNIVSVGSTVSGLIEEIYVDYNSEVIKGQVLAQIDPANFQDEVEQRQASILSAEANLARLKAQEVLNKKTLKRYERLHAKNFIAKSELDQAISDYDSVVAEINAAKAQIAQAKAQYKIALTNLGYTKIIAPVNGTIISREIDLGQPVAASFQAPELFTIAQDLKKMQIEVNVSEADIGEIKEGQKVIYTLDGYQDSEFEGKVTQVRISPTTVSNVVTYSVIVDVNNDDLKLKPGMTANVSIITDEKENVLCAPNMALKFTYIEGNSTKKYANQGIWILDKFHPKRVDIQTGASSDSEFEVISDKLKEGDLVILEQLKGSKQVPVKGRSRMRMF